MRNFDAYLVVLVNGEWGQWSGYSTCTKSCGGGSQMRSRQCSVRNGGKECEGDQTTTRACNEQLCPGMYILQIRCTATSKVCFSVLDYNQILLSYDK